MSFLRISISFAFFALSIARAADCADFKITVSFDSDGGSAVASQKVNCNSTVRVPTPAPTKAGQEFGGWDFNFTTLITKDTTIKAIWKKKLYTIGQLFKGAIEFEPHDFDLDTASSSEHRYHFVGGQNLCNDIAQIEITKLRITFNETDVSLIVNNIPRSYTVVENEKIYEISSDEFSKFGLGSERFIYELISDKGLRSELDTLIIETPIPYDNIVKQKWNNVLFVNNNPNTNGFNTSFKNFKWFQNDLLVAQTQFYSATLNTNYKYRVAMETEKGAKISSCGKNPEKYQEPPKATRTKKIKTKQVLGIQEKSMNSNSKIYNLNGKLTKETPAGVYIVEE